MAQIFVSHSSKDKAFVDFFSNAFAPTKVRAVFEEFEAISQGRRTPNQILADITLSNAVFILLTRNAQGLPHTRDWMVWEMGAASGSGAAGASVNKDVWVFEPFEETPSLSVVIPRLRHYVRFLRTDPWLAYVRDIISSYDDSHVLPAAVGAAAVGGGMGGPAGALAGFLGGAILASRATKQRPAGLKTICAGCRSSYTVHLPDANFRCPVCNERLTLQLPPGIRV